MAKIFFSVAGEGRGHATRVRALVERLRQKHEVVIFAAGMAFDMLSVAYQDESSVGVREIPCLEFQYRGGKLSYFRSLVKSVPYLWNLPSLVKSLKKVVSDERPDLVITDFEPAMARAAKSCQVPFVSLNHQHFLVTCDLSSLPFWLRWRASVLGWFTQLFYSGQQQTIVSSFFTPPLKTRYKDTVQVGVMLRPEVQAATPTNDGHLLVYLRRHAHESFFDALRRCDREVRIYGLGTRADDGNMKFRPISEMGFLEDLRSCHCLISNAGNQLVGEALYLQKPCLVMPETGNFEQSVNAHYLRESGMGDWVDYLGFSSADLDKFLDHVEDYRSRIDSDGICGNEKTLEAIEAILAPKQASSRKLQPA